jgi:tRNA and rRNA cytosine-C5-methylases
VKLTPEVKKLFKSGEITYQSVTSMKAIKALDVADGNRVLDLCSAPGGKSVLISELNPSGSVVACDLYPHRIELVAGYAKRMNAKNIETEILDATIYEHKFLNGFDRVLVDAPCSALGVTRKEPDILLNRKPDDIAELQRTQKLILSNAAKYLRRGGTLIYSTCTFTKEENSEVIADFLLHNEDFALKSIEGERANDGTLQFYPKDEIDGFFIAKTVKR